MINGHTRIIGQIGWVQLLSNDPVGLPDVGDGLLGSVFHAGDNFPGHPNKLYINSSNHFEEKMNAHLRFIGWVCLLSNLSIH